MAVLIDTHAHAAGNGAIAAIRSTFGTFFRRLADAQNRSEAVNRLQALSDRQLADIGIARDDIVRYVYRDIYHI